MSSSVFFLAHGKIYPENTRQISEMCMFTSALKMFGDLHQKMDLSLCFLSCAFDPKMYSFRIVNRIRKTPAPQKRKKNIDSSKKTQKQLRNAKTQKQTKALTQRGPERGPLYFTIVHFLKKLHIWKGTLC